MSMTKKDYEAIAKAIHRSIHITSGGIHLAVLISELSQVFEKDNPMFNSDIFQRACVIGEKAHEL